MARRYTAAEKQFMLDFVPGHSHKEILEEFNKRFAASIKLSQIKSYIANNKLNTGRTGRFEKGQIPANKGKKMPKAAYDRCKGTMFKPGNRPHNHLPVGTEVLNTDGYWQVKIAEPNVWELKHRRIWKQLHGPIPQNHVVIFADQDRQNFDPDNLLLITRAQAVRMSQNGLFKNSKEATKTGTLIAELMVKMAEKKKRRQR